MKNPSEPSPAADPAPRKSCAGRLVAACASLIGAIYLLNPSAGLLELLPDNLPLVGNLDEAGAAGLFILGLQYLFRRDKRA